MSKVGKNTVERNFLQMEFEIININEINNEWVKELVKQFSLLKKSQMSSVFIQALLNKFTPSGKSTNFW